MYDEWLYQSFFNLFWFFFIDVLWTEPWLLGVKRSIYSHYCFIYQNFAIILSSFHLLSWFCLLFLAWESFNVSIIHLFAFHLITYPWLNLISFELFSDSLNNKFTVVWLSVVLNIYFFASLDSSILILYP